MKVIDKDHHMTTSGGVRYPMIHCRTGGGVRIASEPDYCPRCGKRL